MIRSEAVLILKAFMNNPLFSDDHKAAFNIAIHDIEQRLEWDINELMLIPKSESKYDYEILKAHSDGAREALDKVRDEISEYGSIWVSYVITDETKTNKGIEKLVEDVTKQTKTRVLQIIDKYREVE